MAAVAWHDNARCVQEDPFALLSQDLLITGVQNIPVHTRPQECAISTNVDFQACINVSPFAPAAPELSCCESSFISCWISSPHSSVVVLHRTTAHSLMVGLECAVVLCSTTTELCGDGMHCAAEHVRSMCGAHHIFSHCVR